MQIVMWPRNGGPVLYICNDIGSLHWLSGLGEGLCLCPLRLRSPGVTDGVKWDSLQLTMKWWHEGLYLQV